MKPSSSLLQEQVDWVDKDYYGGNHSDIWETKLDKNGKWSNPVIYSAVSTPVNEGRGWVSAKGDMIFFTRCPEEE